jgi:hypothetical protein
MSRMLGYYFVLWKTWNHQTVGNWVSPSGQTVRGQTSIKFMMTAWPPDLKCQSNPLTHSGDRNVPIFTLILISQNLCKPHQSLDFDYVMREASQFYYLCFQAWCALSVLKSCIEDLLTSLREIGILHDVHNSKQQCRGMAAQLTRVTQKIVILWHLLAEGHTTCHSWS